jgi:putative phosphoesterase
MKILITSDSHDRWDYLRKAVEIGNASGCEAMLFAGDLMSPPGLEVLRACKGVVHVVLGNNDGEIGELVKQTQESENIELHYSAGQSIFEEELGELRFYMNHYPSFVKNAANSGKYDVCIYGHDHMYHEEILSNNCFLLNPGEVQGYKTGLPTCMIFDTESTTVEKIALH